MTRSPISIRPRTGSTCPARSPASATRSRAAACRPRRFNEDLATALADLGAAQAVWFAPDSGDLAGQIFLIVDGNDLPGYQPGEDFVFAIGGAPLADLTGHTDIFI